MRDGQRIGWVRIALYRFGLVVCHLLLSFAIVRVFTPQCHSSNLLFMLRQDQAQ